MLLKKKLNRPRISTLPLHLMLLPGVVVVFVYSYLPMFGVVMAFQKYDFTKGVRAIWESTWVGFDNYRRLLMTGEFVRVVGNTVTISALKIVVGFAVPVLVALMLNEVTQTFFKRGIQTIVYIPHFISWVIFASIIRQIISVDGFINTQIFSLLNIPPVNFLADNRFFVPMLVGTDIWKNFGYGTIVYLAAITSIDPSLYEAAVMDGASRLRQTWHVTLPGMRPIIVLTMVLTLQNVLNAGFDQIFNLYNAQVYETADIIDTWVYRMSFGTATPQYSLGMAIGLFKSFVSVFFISLSYWLAYKLARYQIF
jgi:putative aldouronate transport system permease protein